MSDSWTEVSANWNGSLNFVGQNDRGGTVQMNGKTEAPGVGPMQLLLIAAGGCTGMDIVSILEKKRLKLTDLQIKVRGKRAADYPMVWTDIHITYFIWGENIPKKNVEEAIQLSEEKYCSVSLMLRKTSKITSEYFILKPGEVAN